MNYQVVSTTNTSLGLWDGQSKDPDTLRPDVFHMFVGAHAFRVGQEVSISVRLEKDVEVVDA